VSSRSHLSIGEVLSLLQDEFPDVTISKIRFLESQGLVDPERTPSGYRKFYEADIDRLRWVLRQQRDAFLPLKVIKGRLDRQGDLTFDEGGSSFEDASAEFGAEGLRAEEVDVAVTVENGLFIPAMAVEGPGREAGADQDHTGELAGRLFDSGPPEPPHQGYAPQQAYPAHHQGREGTGAEAPVTQGPVTQGPDTQASDTQASDTQASDPQASDPKASGASSNGGDEPTMAEVAPVEGHGQGGSEGGGDAATTGTAPLAGEPTQTTPEPEPARTDNRAKARPEPPSPVRAAGTRVTRPTRRDGSPEVKAVPDDDDLTLEDLVRESGVDLETVQDLERYGLITPRVMGGAPYYTRDAAIVARLAWAFAKHGVEARHLRAYKGAAEREAGLVQQVIMPLIRQRNPEARQAAVQAVEELSSLGGELRAALLRSALAELH
jgi:DNA-binding transcriptional MerR regulator